MKFIPVFVDGSAWGLGRLGMLLAGAARVGGCAFFRPPTSEEMIARHNELHGHYSSSMPYGTPFHEYGGLDHYDFNDVKMPNWSPPLPPSQVHPKPFGNNFGGFKQTK